MAKRRKFHRRKTSFTVPISVVAGFAPGLSKVFYHFTNPGVHGATNGIEAAGIEASRIYTGYDPRTGRWNASLLGLGTIPILIGGLVHKFIGGKLGVNRMLAASRIPFIRL